MERFILSLIDWYTSAKDENKFNWFNQQFNETVKTIINKQNMTKQ